MPVFSYIFFSPLFLQVYPILVGRLFGLKIFIYWFNNVLGTHGSFSLVERREGYMHSLYIYIYHLLVFGRVAVLIFSYKG